MGVEGPFEQLPSLSCGLLGHYHVLEVVESKGTLGCLQCDYREEMGIWCPK